MVYETQKERFATICEFALNKFPKRADKSRAKDMTGYIFSNPWTPDPLRYICLYETDKHIARKQDKPEVYWVVIDERGRVRKMPARNIRMMTAEKAFCFEEEIYERIAAQVAGEIYVSPRELAICDPFGGLLKHYDKTK